MQRTMIDHPRLRVRERTGTEGPRHDPYGYRELEVEVGGNEIVLHDGLGVWIKVNGEAIKTPHGESYVRQYMFPALTGYTVEQLERISNRLRSRCRHCGGRSFHSVDGYPGEHFEVCDGCGNVVDSYFNISEVE